MIYINKIASISKVAAVPGLSVNHNVCLFPGTAHCLCWLFSRWRASLRGYDHPASSHICLDKSGHVLYPPDENKLFCTLVCASTSGIVLSKFISTVSFLFYTITGFSNLKSINDTVFLTDNDFFRTFTLLLILLFL